MAFLGTEVGSNFDSETLYCTARRGAAGFGTSSEVKASPTSIHLRSCEPLPSRVQVFPSSCSWASSTSCCSPAQAAWAAPSAPGEIATALSTLPLRSGDHPHWLVREVNLGRVTIVQLLGAGLIGFLAMPIVREELPAFSLRSNGRHPRDQLV